MKCMQDGPGSLVFTFQEAGVELRTQSPHGTENQVVEEVERLVAQAKEKAGVVDPYGDILAKLKAPLIMTTGARRIDL
ncbi:MAG: hypothetical protein PHX61_05825 [Alphaproteobacteria bacterium]|nr:hypothetical protein [Alphaproteobacteria bacterium]